MALSRALLMPVALIRYGATTIASRWLSWRRAPQPRLAEPLRLDRAGVARGLAQLADYHSRRRYVFDAETGDIVVARDAATHGGAGTRGVRSALAHVAQPRPRHEAASAGRASRSTRAEPRRAAVARVSDERRVPERQSYGG
jgi:hypothetical protein